MLDTQTCLLWQIFACFGVLASKGRERGPPPSCLPVSLALQTDDSTRRKITDIVHEVQRGSGHQCHSHHSTRLQAGQPEVQA